MTTTATRSLRRLLGAAVLTILLLAAAAAPAAAVEVRRCPPIMGFEIEADPVTTTCGLARSAAVSYANQFYYTDPYQPESIYGKSPKTGRTYRLRFRQERTGRRWRVVVYTGRAGTARLHVQFRFGVY